MTYDSSRLRRLALIALALQSTGRIEGRTKLQKILYLANLCGWNALDFKYHNYGPYSDTLASELENMRNNGWVEEREIGTSQDRVLYTYSLSRESARIATSLINKVRDMSQRDDKMVSRSRGLVKQLNEFTSDELEIMATLIFLRMQDPTIKGDEAVRVAHELKPRFSDTDISKGGRIFSIMRDFLPRAKSL